jgi:hypothetical protein
MNRARKRTGLPTRTLTSHVGKGGIAYQARASWRRSSQSSQMLRVMPQTRRRGTGRGRLSREGVGRAMRQSCSMLKGMVTFAGEPCARKPACAVRRGEVGCACNLLWSCSKEQQVGRDARGKRHASGNGISRGVKPADKDRPTQSEGTEGLPL